MYESHALAKELQDAGRKEERLARIEQMEDRIYDRASGVLEAALSFHEVSPFEETPPESWVRDYGQEGAEQRLAVAKSGWMPQSHAPSGVKLAAQVVAGISRGRAHRGQKIQVGTLNVKIGLPAPATAEHPGPEVYPRKAIE